MTSFLFTEDLLKKISNTAIIYSLHYDVLCVGNFLEDFIQTSQLD